MVIYLPGVLIRDTEAFEDAYRRFKKQTDRNLVVTESKARRFFETNPEKKKKEKIASRKKILKKLYMLRRYESRL
jgi:small subunit ribosomal protein S21